MTRHYKIIKNLKKLEQNIPRSPKLIKYALKKKQKFFIFFKITKQLSLIFNIKKKYKKEVIEKKVFHFKLSLNNKKSNQKKAQNRLDFLLYQVCFCSTIFFARHLIRKGFIFINNEPMSFCNYRVKAKDIVFVKNKIKKEALPLFFEYQGLRIHTKAIKNLEVSFSTFSFVKIY